MFLSISELAELAGVNPRPIQIAVKSGNPWRGVKLRTRQTNGKGGRSGVQYEVALDSLPNELREKWNALRVETKQPEIIETATQPKPEPETMKPAIDPQAEYDLSYCKFSLWVAWELAKNNKRKKAADRLETILKIEELIAHGRKKNEAIDQVVGKKGRASIYRWYNDLKGIERADWLPSLLPSNTGRVGVTSNYDEEVYQAYKTYFLTPMKRTSAHCYDLAVEEVKAKNPQAKIPAEATLRKRLKTEVAPQVIDFCRNGDKAKSFQNPIPPQRRSKFGMWALQSINGDGYDHKFYVIFPDGEEYKPTTWFWQDVYSGYILGWYCDKTENSDMLRLALREVIKGYGLGVDGQPFTIVVDNTHAASALTLTGQDKRRRRFKHRTDEPLGIFAKLGCQYSPTLPYSGQSKPIERKFGIGGVSQRVDQDPLVENARNKGQGVSWNTFQGLLKTVIQKMNNDISQSDVCAGVKTPQQVFEDSLSKHIPIKATEQQLRMLMMCAIGVQVHKQYGSISFMNNSYYNPILLKHCGQKVQIEYDPNQLQAGVEVYQLDGRHICKAECTQAVGFHDTSAAREQMKLKRQQQRLIKQQAEVERKQSALSRRQENQPEPVEQKEIELPKVVGLDFTQPTSGQDQQSKRERERRYLERMRNLEEVNRNKII